ncbi:hypothetical protein BKA70DRAFT_1316117 [Coprinopsis sp. MPI-PUGE-AT-0042]|nr:hypothetical protein BKA70DRAFT_1316117 [Coprinopsis sp. MPI-PUGE-AT-0042]
MVYSAALSRWGMGSVFTTGRTCLSSARYTPRSLGFMANQRRSESTSAPVELTDSTKETDAAKDAPTRPPVQIFVAGLGDNKRDLLRRSIGHYIVHSIVIHYKRNPMVRVRGGNKRVLTLSLPFHERPVEIIFFQAKQFPNCVGPSLMDAYRATRKSKKGPAMGENLVVLADSIAHPEFRTELVYGASDVPHQGYKSIASALGTKRSCWWLHIGMTREDRGTPVPEPAPDPRGISGDLTMTERKYWGPGGAGIELILAELSKVAKQLEVSQTDAKGSPNS